MDGREHLLDVVIERARRALPHRCCYWAAPQRRWAKTICFRPGYLHLPCPAGTVTHHPPPRRTDDVVILPLDILWTDGGCWFSPIPTDANYLPHYLVALFHTPPTPPRLPTHPAGLVSVRLDTKIAHDYTRGRGPYR